MKKQRHSNKGKYELWLAVLIFVVFLGLTLGKLFLNWKVDLTDVQLILSTIGALLVLVGTMVGNRVMIMLGKKVTKENMKFRSKK